MRSWQLFISSMASLAQFDWKLPSRRNIIRSYVHDVANIIRYHFFFRFTPYLQFSSGYRDYHRRRHQTARPSLYQAREPAWTCQKAHVETARPRYSSGVLWAPP